MNSCLFGDCRESLVKLAADGVRVNTCITSPPYWGLRKYAGPTVIFGAAPDCSHSWGEPASISKGSGRRGASSQFKARTVAKAQDKIMKFEAGSTCDQCGAWRGNLGLEAVHDCLAWARGEPPCGACYVCHMREIFGLVWDVLADDGTLWLNLGDSYATSGGPKSSLPTNTLRGTRRSRAAFRTALEAHDKSQAPGLKYKDLVGIPWRVAFALQADGWCLRSDNIWWKVNGMPESCEDRTTRDHEYFFMFSKQDSYYFDFKSIEEPMAEASLRRLNQPTFDEQTGGDKDYGTTGVNVNRSSRRTLENLKATNDGMRRKRTVWPVPTKPYLGAHCATFPQDLVTVPILAGCPPGGTVLDIFFGTGTTGAEAQRLGRNFLGCELDETCKAQQDDRLRAELGLAL